MANVKLTAIRPKNVAVLAGSGARNGLDRELRNFIGKLHDEMATYPSQLPTKSGYVRTGEYGRGWDEELGDSPREVRLVNRVVATDARYQTKTKGVVRRRSRKPRRYASYVAGPRKAQTAEMARRKWKRIDKVAARLWPASKARIVRILQGNV